MSELKDQQHFKWYCPYCMYRVYLSGILQNNENLPLFKVKTNNNHTIVIVYILYLDKKAKDLRRARADIAALSF